MTQDTPSHLSPADATSLRCQLAEMEENLRLSEERQSQYVMGVDVPLQLEKREQELRREIAALKAKLAGAKTTPPKQPSAAPLHESPPNPFTDVFAIRDLDRFVGREAALERLLRLLEGGSVGQAREICQPCPLSNGGWTPACEFLEVYTFLHVEKEQQRIEVRFDCWLPEGKATQPRCGCAVSPWKWNVGSAACTGCRQTAAGRGPVVTPVT